MLWTISENSLAKQLQNVNKISGKTLKLLKRTVCFQVFSSICFHTNYGHAELKINLI